MLHFWLSYRAIDNLLQGQLSFKEEEEGEEEGAHE